MGVTNRTSGGSIGSVTHKKRRKTQEKKIYLLQFILNKEKEGGKEEGENMK